MTESITSLLKTALAVLSAAVLSFRGMGEEPDEGREPHLPEGAVTRFEVLPEQQPYAAVDFSPDESLVSVAGLLREVESGKAIAKIDHGAVVYLANGDPVLVTRDERGTRIWRDDVTTFTSIRSGKTYWTLPSFMKVKLAPPTAYDNDVLVLLPGYYREDGITRVFSLNRREQILAVLPKKAKYEEPEPFAIQAASLRGDRFVGSYRVGAIGYADRYKQSIIPNSIYSPKDAQTSVGLYLSPDGRRIALRVSRNRKVSIKLWDVEAKTHLFDITGLESFRVPRYSFPVFFSGSEQHLVAQVRPLSEHRYAVASLRIFEIASGKEVRQLPREHHYSPPLPRHEIRLSVPRRERRFESFSPYRNSLTQVCLAMENFALSRDLRLAARPLKDGAVEIWETATNKLVETFRWELFDRSILEFSPSGKYLLTRGTDQSYVLWDCTFGARPEFAQSADLEGIWSDLASRDPKTGQRAAWLLAMRGDEAVRFAGSRLAPPDSTARIERLISDLDDDDFAVRDAATKRLTEQGAAAIPLLEKAVKSSDSVEVKTRGKSILVTLQGAGKDPDFVRLERVVQAMEKIGSDNAIGVLRTLAQSSTDSDVRLSARDALRRMGRTVAIIEKR